MFFHGVSMLAEQYLMAMHHNEHPNHHQLHFQGQLRNKKVKGSLLDFKPRIQKYTEGQLSLDKPTIKTKIKKIHSDTVQQCLNSYPPSKVLNANLPEISDDEKLLPRCTRLKLSQLRSSYSPFLNFYLHRINRTGSDRCPKCYREPHTTNHLFECVSNPTNLQPKDLWLKPIKTSEFLQFPTREEDPEDPG